MVMVASMGQFLAHQDNFFILFFWFKIFLGRVKTSPVEASFIIPTDIIYMLLDLKVLNFLYKPRPLHNYVKTPKS